MDGPGPERLTAKTLGLGREGEMIILSFTRVRANPEAQAEPAGSLSPLKLMQ